MAYMHGQVVDFTNKKPLVGATVEVWQASTNGLYEQQDPEQEEFNLRGKFRTDEQGRYEFYCLRPTPYPVPDDGMLIPFLYIYWVGCILTDSIGPAGKLLELMDRHPFRPAHIHIIVCSLHILFSSLIVYNMLTLTFPGHPLRLPPSHNANLRPQGHVPRQRLRLRGQGFPGRGLCAAHG